MKIATISALTLLLAACSSTHVVVEKVDGGETRQSTVSVTATATGPALLYAVDDLRDNVEIEMILECSKRRAQAKQSGSINALKSVDGLIFKVAKIATALDNIIKTTTGWLPDNSYTAAWKC